MNYSPLNFIMKLVFIVLVSSRYFSVEQLSDYLIIIDASWHINSPNSVQVMKHHLCNFPPDSVLLTPFFPTMVIFCCCFQNLYVVKLWEFLGTDSPECSPL